MKKFFLLSPATGTKGVGRCNTIAVHRNLVIVRAGDTSLHEKWFSGRVDRNWDLIVGYSGDDPGLFRGPDVLRVDIKGPKWPALYRLVQDLDELVFDYDYIWLPDDDLEMDVASINTMFDMCAEHQLSLAQPALTRDSRVNHLITVVDLRYTMRYTNFVEGMAPCLSREFLRRCAFGFAAAPSGAEPDTQWPTMLDDDRMAIIDAVTMFRPHRFPGRDDAARMPGVRTPPPKGAAPLTGRDVNPVVHSVRGGIPADPGFDFPQVDSREPRLDHLTVPATTRKLDPADCIVLVPVADRIEPGCARALFELEQQGYPVWRVYGASEMEQARSQMATDALAAGFEELMWIDPDIEFPTDAVTRLRGLDLPVACAIYAKKDARELVVHLESGTTQLVFGEAGAPVEIRYAAPGFLLTKRHVYEKIQAQESLPVCGPNSGRPTVPYFLPMIVEEVDECRYLGEGFAFCERARRSGFSIMADTRIRLGNIGRRTFCWEDAGTARERYGTYTFNLV